MITTHAPGFRRGSVSKALPRSVAALLLSGWLLGSAAGACLAEPASEAQRRPESEQTSEQGGGAGADPGPPVALAPERPIPVFDLTADSLGGSGPAWPEPDGSCYVYERYVVIAWGSPDPQPVAIVRQRDSEDSGAADCSRDSLAGDFVLRNEWAEYFSGMWGDLLLVDSGTGDIRSLILYDVAARRKVLELEGAGETDGWISEHTVRIWMLAATDLPRAVCPDIPEMLGVGVDSLYALNLETLRLTPLGPWRCHALQ
jgi:hypothetical protein